MTEALAAPNQETFVKPPGADLQSLQVCADSGQIANAWCPKKETRSFFPRPCSHREVHAAQGRGIHHAKHYRTEVRQRLQDDHGGRPGSGTWPFGSDGSKPFDTVIDQAPKPGTKVKQGVNRVTIYVAGLPGSVQIPAEEPHPAE